MSKMAIRNCAQAQWSSVLEARAALGLGSLPAISHRIDIELHQAPGKDGVFTCSISVMMNNGDTHNLHNTQPNAVAAIDGVIARARRAIARRGQVQANNEQALVTV